MNVRLDSLPNRGINQCSLSCASIGAAAFKRRTSNLDASTRQTNSHGASSGDASKQGDRHKCGDRRPSGLERSGWAVKRPPQLSLGLRESFSYIVDCDCEPQPL